MVLCHNYAAWKSKEMGELTLLNIMLTIFRLVIVLLLTDCVNYFIHLLLAVSNFC